MSQVKPEIRDVPLDELKEAAYNPRRGNVDAIKESLSVHGQYRPIVARKETGEVLAGNHTLKAAAELGWETIQVAFIDVGDEQAKRILVADNRTSDLAVNDDEALSKLLQELEGLEGTAYNDDDLAELRRITGELADEAMQDLDDALGLEDDLDEPPTERPEYGFVVSFTVTAQQRAVIMAALRHMIDTDDEGDILRSEHALMALCESYNAANDVSVEMPELRDE